ncbi:hypothetical protein GCM10007937_53890 [Mesorhizobium albiziae]|nr:hypothetical protein GCM10007937_53890 [Mesorhizobium albiziae]
MFNRGRTHEQASRGAADAVADAAIEGVACAESGTDIGSGKVRIGAAPCRERLPGVTAHTFAGPAQFGFRAGRRDADDEEGGAPVS